MTDISTSGWDVVSITDLDTINKIINSDRLYPPDFLVNDSDAIGEINVTGKWGTWKVTSNASGAKVNIRCEIANGTVVYSGTSMNINDDSGNSYVEIELSLKGISAEPEKWVSNNDVIVDSTRCYQLMADPDSTVIIADSDFTGIDSHLLQLLLPELFKEWFDGNITAFKQVFSVILIGLKAGNSDFQWLYPSAYSYAANSSIDGNNTGFGALTLIDGKTDTGSLQQSVDIAALSLVKTFGANLALVVSKEKYVKHILLPAAISIVKGSSASDFTISDTGLSLTNNREMVWEDFEDGKGGTFSPVLLKESFILDLQSDFIHLSILGAHFRPNNMCTATMGVEQNFRYKVEKNASGEPVFVPDEKALGDAKVSCSVKPDSWVEALEIALGVISGLAAIFAVGSGFAAWLGARAAATIAEDAAEELVVFTLDGFEEAEEEGVVTVEDIAAEAGEIARGKIATPTLRNAVKMFSAVSAITGASAAIPGVMAAVYVGKYDDVPSFHGFARSVTGATVWPGMDNTELKSASLADSFVIGLELK
ncbi:TULIP family P47-like protein [Serratia ficaria]|uniref:TULIP family P47-like protein n=1 Tax=Serratia ficaria TaxID=61651 RepID=UPI00077C66FD|nr:TULIP family P47-like protein [Serratia ficaria]CAI1890995.1 Clostridium P-47 protein [Serratia ficaria]VVA49794.1 Clostridium P-47 protein [Serratia ficaria]